LIQSHVTPDFRVRKHPEFNFRVHRFPTVKTGITAAHMHCCEEQNLLTAELLQLANGFLTATGLADDPVFEYRKLVGTDHNCRGVSGRHGQGFFPSETGDRLLRGLLIQRKFIDGWSEHTELKP
jgi:hypothetical protein